MPKRVLIAHQSTIPHYRVSFYEWVERLRPEWWEFGVVWDMEPTRRQKFFVEPVNSAAFGFPVFPTRTFAVTLGGTRIALQSFVTRCREFDLIVVEDALHNLSYPLMWWWKHRGAALAYWGHGRDRSAVSPSGWKRLAEDLKLRLTKNVDAYFAYTDGVRRYLVDSGVSPDAVFVLNNTIDILEERSAHEEAIAQRERFRRERGLAGKCVLLYVGRLDRRKNLPFLARAVQRLVMVDSRYHLVVIGGGDASYVELMTRSAGSDAITYGGVVVDRQHLARWYASADAYVFPGDVGLGVVQALSHSLTPVVLERPTHNPEFEYLGDMNAVIVPAPVTPRSYAEAIHELCSDSERWEQLRAAAWPSIRHLTIQAMAQNFVDGVGSVLEAP